MSLYSRTSGALCALTIAFSIASPVLAADTGPAIAPFGIDLGGGDAAVKPGDDFYAFAGGTWMKTEKLPADRTSWTSFTKLADENETRIRGLLEEARSSAGAPGSIAQKIGDFYASFLDEARINTLGLAKAEPALDQIHRANSHDAIARLMGSPGLGLPTPIEIGVTLDEKNPDRYVVGVSHGGLGLPDRDFYLRDEDQFKSVRAAYQAHIERMLKLAGYPAADVAADHILRLETEIAKLHWPRADRRDRDRTYNPMTLAELKTLAPEFPWDSLFAGAELPDPGTLIVSEKSAIAPLGHLFRTTDLNDWRGYLSYHFLAHHAAVLPTQFDK